MPISIPTRPKTPHELFIRNALLVLKKRLGLKTTSETLFVALAKIFSENSFKFSGPPTKVYLPPSIEPYIATMLRDPSILPSMKNLYDSTNTVSLHPVFRPIESIVAVLSHRAVSVPLKLFTAPDALYAYEKAFFTSGANTALVITTYLTPRPTLTPLSGAVYQNTKNCLLIPSAVLSAIELKAPIYAPKYGRHPPKQPKPPKESL